MREILFRAKCIDETCLKGKWVEGDILHDGITGKCYININNCLNESDKVREEGFLQFVAYEADPSTVCQYTGLEDKNGRKIFEGDIVEVPTEDDERYTIEWDNDTARFTIAHGSVVCDFGNYWGHELEVIGNIYDNPERQQTSSVVLHLEKNGEFAEKYLRKGTKILIEGRIQTGSYTNREKIRIYTTDIVVESQEFAESKNADQQEGRENPGEGFMNIPEGINEELPFN